MKQWIQLPQAEGGYSKQAHADLPEGTYEREMGQEGFFGPCTHLHHCHAPTGWSEFEGPLKPRAFDLIKLSNPQSSPWQASLLLHNPATKIRWWCIEKSMEHLARNADGDDLLFIHKGNADLFCDYGHLAIAEGDYVLLPRGTQWRLEIHSSIQALLVEATNGHYKLPEKGLLGPQAIFDPAALETPAINEKFKDQYSSAQEWQVIVKRRDQLTTITFPYNPLDAIGWHGTLFPVKLNWRDIRPIMSHRYHLPPSAHTTFVADRFVVCTFCPRPIESDPGALKIPFFHSNDDFDEVLFYHQGKFFSRDNIHPGMMTLHPSGFIHGPHPGAFKVGQNALLKETHEVAVMIDTRDALEIAGQAHAVEDIDYVHSWKGITKP
jgi:homogentisate 1,2-dioxygenase